MKIGDIEYPSLKGKVSDAEWEARVNLAAIYRLIPIMGWYDTVMAPASARIPGEDAYLFNPKGFLFEEITASSLVKISIEGEKQTDTPFEISRPGWYPLRAVHEAAESAVYVLHTHDDWIAALSARKQKLFPSSQTAAFLIASGISYHLYDGVETMEERMPGLKESLGDNHILIMHNHGAVTAGVLPWHAVGRMESLAKACRIQVLASQNREDLFEIGEDIMVEIKEELRRGPAVDNPWPGLLRKLDRLDPSYKE
ncbi:MAG: class II aldolase/adducin family protein [Pseudodonghicola sp.]